ncbi:hypothetical protein AGMMS50230_18620 [Spirochaetia bacterium]|nr:hypothetical protein AGMMS50230_18620 [Spirochaetia bacterium]
MSGKTKPRNDPVNHPGHYTFGKYEVIDVLEDWFPIGPAALAGGEIHSPRRTEGEHGGGSEKSRMVS